MLQVKRAYRELARQLHPDKTGGDAALAFTQMHTDGVHCQESAGTGPLVLNVVGIASPWAVFFYTPLFFHAHYMYVMDTYDTESIGYNVKSAIPSIVRLTS